MTRLEREEQNIFEILESNFADIDSETLEAYSIVRQNHPEILMVENFDVSKEKLDFFTQRHFEIYNEQAEEIYKNLPKQLVLSSGMFGGKTTLSFLLLERFLKEGKQTALLIADVMGEDYITARSYKGCQQRPAHRFGSLTNYRETIDVLSNSVVDVVFLDEFSFLDINIVQELQKMCQEEGKNLVLTGLNASYLGQPLPAFCDDCSVLKNSLHQYCFSFVSGFCEEVPQGTNTIRYVKMDNRWVLDIGLLPLVVSKENSHIVHYAPAMYCHTAVSMLEDFPELLEGILRPSPQKMEKQKEFLHKLSPSY